VLVFSSKSRYVQAVADLDQAFGEGGQTRGPKKVFTYLNTKGCMR